jgi:ParB-like nuclease domain
MGKSMPVVRRNTLQKNAGSVIHNRTDLHEDVRDRLNLRVHHTKLECVAIEDLKPNRRNAKKHPERQIALLVENYKLFGVTQPIVIDEDGMILCGHARHLAAMQLGLTHLPAIRLSHLTPVEKRALAIADNKLAALGEWDLDQLQEELEFLFDSETELSFDPYIIGFETPELDQILLDSPDVKRADPDDRLEPPDPEAVATTVKGDVWICAEHQLLCGDALKNDDYQALMGDEKAQTVFATVHTMFLMKAMSPAARASGSSRWRPARCHLRLLRHSIARSVKTSCVISPREP